MINVEEIIKSIYYMIVFINYKEINFVVLLYIVNLIKYN